MVCQITCCSPSLTHRVRRVTCPVREGGLVGSGRQAINALLDYVNRH